MHDSARAAEPAVNSPAVHRPAAPCPVLGVHRVGFIVADLSRSRQHFQRLGFECGADTVSGDMVRADGGCGGVRVRLLAGATPSSRVASFVEHHGDGVYEIALRVTSADEVCRSAIAAGFERGAPFTPDPGGSDVTVVEPDSGLHFTLLTDGGQDAAPCPGDGPGGRAFDAVDHFVIAVPPGRMHPVAQRLCAAFGFALQHDYSDGRISTGRSELRSVILWDGRGDVHLTVTEPVSAHDKSQVAVFLDENRGPGVQHVALRLEDIASWVGTLRERGIGFLNVPDSYYAALADRVPGVKGQIAELRSANVLADQEDSGYLLQIFTETISPRPTFFFELIERHGAIGFGEGNIQALYEAVEADQRSKGLA